MIAENSKIMPDSEQFFDNPLRQEFLPLREVAEFLNHSESWVLQKTIEGILPCYHVGKNQHFFYVEDLRNAILGNLLALPRRYYAEDKTKEKVRTVRDRSMGQGEWEETLQDIRYRKRGRSVAYRDALSKRPQHTFSSRSCKY